LTVRRPREHDVPVIVKHDANGNRHQLRAHRPKLLQASVEGRETSRLRRWAGTSPEQEAISQLSPGAGLPRGLTALRMTVWFFPLGRT
jgi:hypothetical protein